VRRPSLNPLPSSFASSVAFAAFRFHVSSATQKRSRADSAGKKTAARVPSTATIKRRKPGKSSRLFRFLFTAKSPTVAKVVSALGFVSLLPSRFLPLFFSLSLSVFPSQRQQFQRWKRQSRTTRLGLPLSRVSSCFAPISSACRCRAFAKLRSARAAFPDEWPSFSCRHIVMSSCHYRIKGIARRR